MAATYQKSKIIFNALKEVFPSSMCLTDLAVICKCSPQKAWDNLAYLVNRGLVKKTGWGQYCFIGEE
jgi:hypothetical protein